jgi:hypothetical protein
MPKTLADVKQAIVGTGVKKEQKESSASSPGADAAPNGCYGYFPLPTTSSEEVAQWVAIQMGKMDGKEGLSCALAVASTAGETEFIVAFSGEAAGAKGVSVKEWFTTLKPEGKSLKLVEFASAYRPLSVSAAAPVSSAASSSAAASASSAASSSAASSVSSSASSSGAEAHDNVSCAEPKLFKSSGSSAHQITGMSVLWFSGEGKPNPYPLFPGETSSGTWMKPCMTCRNNSQSAVTGSVAKSLNLDTGWHVQASTLKDRGKAAGQGLHYDNRPRTGTIHSWDPIRKIGFIKDPHENRFFLGTREWEHAGKPALGASVSFYAGKAPDKEGLKKSLPPARDVRTSKNPK